MERARSVTTFPAATAVTARQATSITPYAKSALVRITVSRLQSEDVQTEDSLYRALYETGEAMGADVGSLNQSFSVMTSDLTKLGWITLSRVSTYHL